MKDELHNFSKKAEEAPTPTVSDEVWKDISANDLVLKPMRGAEKRIVDQYGRDEIDEHLQHYAEHCAARGLNPTMKVIVDWLYSTKRPSEKDDFVKISRLIQMLKEGTATPGLILEVLEYAQKVEAAAIKVYDDFHFLKSKYKSMRELEDALNIRLAVREDEKNGATAAS